MIRMLFIFGALLVIAPDHSLAQIAPVNDVQSRHQLRISVAGMSCNALTLRNTGPSLLTSDRGAGMEITAQYSMPLFKTFRLNLGLGFSRVSTRYDYNITDLSSSAFAGSGYDFFTTRGIRPRITQTIWTLPVSLERSFILFKNPSWRFNVEAGLKLNFKAAYPYSTSGRSSAILNDQNPLEYFSYELESTPVKVYASYTLKTGIMKFNKRGDSYHFNLVYQHAPTPLWEGSYEFHNLGYQSFGTMTQRPGSFGLELGYGISINKRKRK